MRVPRWCLPMQALPITLLLLSLMPLPLPAGESSWDSTYGYTAASRQTSGAATGESHLNAQGTRDAYTTGGAPNGIPSGASPPSLYETLRRDPGLGRAQSGRIETPATPPGPDRGRYRFRGDGPVDVGEPASASDYRYRPLTAQERDRGQSTSGWRPLNAPRQESPSSLGPPPPASRPDRQPSGWTQDQSPYPDLPGMPNHEAENWFNRHYGEGRR